MTIKFNYGNYNIQASSGTTTKTEQVNADYLLVQANAKKQSVWQEVAADNNQKHAEMNEAEAAYYALNVDFSKYQDELGVAETQLERYSTDPNNSNFSFAKMTYDSKQKISFNKDLNRSGALEAWKNKIAAARRSDNFSVVAWASLNR